MIPFGPIHAAIVAFLATLVGAAIRQRALGRSVFPGAWALALGAGIATALLTMVFERYSGAPAVGLVSAVVIAIFGAGLLLVWVRRRLKYRGLEPPEFVLLAIALLAIVLAIGEIALRISR